MDLLKITISSTNLTLIYLITSIQIKLQNILDLQLDRMLIWRASFLQP